MSLVRPHQPRSGQFLKNGRSFYVGKLGEKNQDTFHDLPQNDRLDGLNNDCAWPDTVPSSKRRKILNLPCESTGRPYQHQFTCQNDISNHADHCQLPRTSNVYNVHLVCNSNRDQPEFEDDGVVFMSRDEIESSSPSRKDGIDQLHETYLRYSYCAFLQNVGVRLDLPQTTIGTAMVLCHRFFVRRSHATHDRFLIATSVLFLAAKSEETPRALTDVLRASCEILHKQDFTLLSFMLPIDWFEQYHQRIIDAEQLVLTTLNFELNVQHPYDCLTSTLQTLGFSHSLLVTLALNLVSEGLKSSLWLQFKPHQIAAGAAYLAAKFLNMNLASCHNVWHGFHTQPSILKDVAHQLMELF